MRRVLDGDDPRAVAEAATALRAGLLVALPTETVYGLGANALDARAVARIFEAKGRPHFDPLIVHVPDADAVGALAQFDDLREAFARLSAAFWPGPLTLVLPRRPVVPDLVTSGLPSVAVRVPRHPVTRAVLRAAGVPVAAPSANPFGYVSPTTAAHVADQLGDAVDLILDGGPCAIGLESTIVSLLDDRPTLLRPGGIPRADLEAVIGPIAEGVRVLERPLAPGQLARHYATRTPLRLIAPDALTPAPERALLVLAGSPPAGSAGYGQVVTLAPGGDLTATAAALFATLRTLDAAGHEGVDVLPCPLEGLGVAIMDRVRRATVSG